MHKLSPLAAALAVALGACAAHAQETPPPAPAGDAAAAEGKTAQPRPDTARPGQPAARDGKDGKDSRQQPQQVTITGSQNEVDKRRQSTASKIIFGREDLDRAGDSNLGEVLKRLPGVTIGGRPGRGGDIRMRGMGAGFTQILLNGERPPPGFSMDQITPDQVERIEVMRAPVAEFSTQAIAGTINIVLRENVQLKKGQVAVADTIEGGRHAPSVSVTWPGEAGPMSYVLSGSVQQNRQGNDSVTVNTESDRVTGAPSSAQSIATRSRRDSTNFHFTPRLTWKLAGGDQLAIQPFLMHMEGKTQTDQTLVQTLGTAPYATAHGDGSFDTTFGRAFGTWQHRFANNGRVNLRFSFGGGKIDTESRTHQYDAAGTEVHDYVDNATIKDKGFSSGGKYTSAVTNGHAFGFGWDGDMSFRDQTRVSLDRGLPQTIDSGDNLSAKTRRLAVYAQDEWDINKEFSAYFGLRWEGVKVSSESTTATFDTSTSVFSPVLHGVWHIPGHEKDQVRASLTHAYRAPQTGDLIPTLQRSQLNQSTSPDRAGNPALKPELSTGVEVAFEHYLPNGGVLSANVYSRDIKDVIRRVTAEEVVNGETRWVSRPTNIGKARTSGIELEAKFQLADVIADAPAVDLRANYSRFFSSVDGIPGPNNRIDQQPKQTANLGADYRLRGLPLTLGGSINWTPDYTIQTSPTQASYTGLKRQVDVYALWKFDPDTQLRISANNLVNTDYITGTTIANGAGAATSTNYARTYTAWTIRFEKKI